MEDSAAAIRWAEATGLDFMAVRIQTNAHDIELIFSDLEVAEVPYGTVPFEVTRDV